MPRRTTIPAAQSFTEPRHRWQLTGTSRLDNENPTNVTRMRQHNACSWQVADGVNRLQEAHLWRELITARQASRHTSHHCSILFIEKNLTISKEQEYKQHLSHSKEENIKHMFILESSWGVCFWSLWGRWRDLITWMDSSKEEEYSGGTCRFIKRIIMFKMYIDKPVLILTMNLLTKMLMFFYLSVYEDKLKNNASWW